MSLLRVSFTGQRYIRGINFNFYRHEKVQVFHFTCLFGSVFVRGGVHDGRRDAQRGRGGG
jgi:hypothetical protein